MELLILDIIGTIAFTISGFIIGVKNKLDFLGITLLALLSAFGGGVVRDLLVDRTPFIFTADYPIYTSLVVIIIASLFKIHTYEKLEEHKLFVLSDTIGLSVFAYTGASIGLQYSFNFMGVVFLSLLTATGGGIIRDTVISKIPYVFKSDFYGTVAIIIGILTFLLSFATIAYGYLYIIFIGVLIRVLAIRYRWELPKF